MPFKQWVQGVRLIFNIIYTLLGAGTAFYSQERGQALLSKTCLGLSIACICAFCVHLRFLLAFDFA